MDWGNEDHIKTIGPPFDYIIGTDIVYAEHLLEPLLQTLFALSGPRTTILLGYEIRSTSVHELMFKMWKEFFEVKIVPKSKMDSKYQHPSIQLYIMGLKPLMGSTKNTSCSLVQQIGDVGTSKRECVDSGRESNVLDDKVEIDSVLVRRLQDEDLTDWDARRYGSMAARLLRDVKIT